MVSMDGQSISKSGKILLQIMTEEQPTGWATEPSGPDLERIVHLGRDPWQIRAIRGKVELRRADAARLRVTALDARGRRGSATAGAASIPLLPGTMHYLIEQL